MKNQLVFRSSGGYFLCNGRNEQSTSRVSFGRVAFEFEVDLTPFFLALLTLIPFYLPA
jgi:hypothetical protein